MSLKQDEAVLDGQDGAAPAPEVRRVGELLRAGREAVGLSCAELARQLRLGERQIEALEQGEWTLLPGSTFVRGFVRNYAKAVQLDPAPLLAQLERETQLVAPRLELPESTHVTIPGQGRRLSRDWLMVLAGLALVLAAVAAYFFLPDEFWIEKPPPAPVGVAEAPSGQASAPGTPSFPPAAEQEGAQPPQPADAAAPAAPVDAPVPAPQAQAQAQAAPAVPPASGAASVAGATISLAFARDSWVEVRDKDNNLIVSRLHPAGTTRDISGAGPLSVVIGNASYVKLRYKGQDVPLQPNPESDVARLTLP
ncbi:helix-turn-helix domain-containing protein [Azovibrio restrictus]|uniref:helix-turn-helix domain-containing protein n=1 Tax=Azovibrio restrictus TaxID=146938 RepID=UPI0026EE6F55|nr:helix-turn-helix domain-containing protein [Azovibrio restrictus]